MSIITTEDNHTTPFFVFTRMPKIERERGVAIAGLLVLDFPAGEEMSDEWEKGIDFIVKQYAIFRFHICLFLRPR